MMTNYPSSRPSKRPKAEAITLPVSFTLFLYAGLAGLLLIFVICVVRVFIRHYYLCNFKLFNSGDSRIEIIREADIVCNEADVHLATVVSSFHSLDSHTISFESVPIKSIDLNDDAFVCNTHLSSYSEDDINQPTIALPVDVDSTTDRCNRNDLLPDTVLIASGVASTMTVMESVPGQTDHGNDDSISQTQYRSTSMQLLSQSFQYL